MGAGGGPHPPAIKRACSATFLASLSANIRCLTSSTAIWSASNSFSACKLLRVCVCVCVCVCARARAHACVCTRCVCVRALHTHAHTLCVRVRVCVRRGHLVRQQVCLGVRTPDAHGRGRRRRGVMCHNVGRRANSCSGLGRHGARLRGANWQRARPILRTRVPRGFRAGLRECVEEARKFFQAFWQG